jgi:cation diffusion facilitator CzcD-associated flavoprotein CzcO
MTTTTQSPHDDVEASAHDAIVLGAGIGGLYALYRLRELGMDVIALEAERGLGGTWYRNRYPGCRFDSESYSYGYSFSQELLDEWNWSELFAAQPETLRYVNYVADKFDLRRQIVFGSRAVAAVFDESQERWTVRVEDGRQFVARFLVSAVGALSSPTVPRYAADDVFAGRAFHTIEWPDDLDLAGKRVGVVGTGSSGVQVISEIADQVGELTVFQLRPGWCAPLHNAPISAAEMERIRASYDEIFERCRQSPSGFIHAPDPRKTFDVAPQERLAFWEQLYRAPGMGIWLGNFKDTLMSPEANAELSAFVAEKIRGRVHDPRVAELLVPKDHGFGSARVALETGYYEVYNMPHVRLVDVSATPVTHLTRDGLATTEREYQLDVIVYATGFDAFTGPFDEIDIVGRGGERLKDKWADGPITSYGIQVHGFPNLLMLGGPQGGSGSTNVPRGLEEAVDWVAALLKHMDEHGFGYVETTAEAELDWVAHVKNVSTMLLVSRTKSWFTGHNVNVDRADTPRFLIYAGGNLRYRARLAEEVRAGYPAFVLREGAGRTSQPA